MPSNNYRNVNDTAPNSLEKPITVNRPEKNSVARCLTATQNKQNKHEVCKLTPLFSFESPRSKQKFVPLTSLYKSYTKKFG